MLNVEYRLKLGQDEFIIKGEYKNEKEFFNKMSFFSSLPKTAPGGATDLKLVVRETKKGKYYSLISESEKLEFQLGQHKEGDTLYAKGWVPLYQGNDSDYEEGQQSAAPVGAPVAAPKAAAPRAAAPIAAPVAAAAPMPVPQTVQAPVAAPVAAPTPVAVPQPVAAPVQAAPAAAAPAANPQVTAVANNVLARFGINK